jgi:hypothetical protein
MKLLKQSTARYILLGPFLDATDGVTAEAGLAGSMTVYVSKDGAAQAARNSATAIAYDARGYYRVHLDATDTATLGVLRVLVHDSATHLPVWADFMVVPAMIYDTLVAGTDYMDSQVKAIDTDAITAASLNADAVTEIQANMATASALATAQSGITTIAGYIDTEVAAIKAKTDTIPSSPATEATLATIAAYIDTEVAAIKAKTDNLPSDPADASDIAALFSTVNSKLDAIDDYVDTEIAAIKAKTDTLADIYYADIKLTRDEVNDQDEYTVIWFKNGSPVTSGISGTPTIRVYTRAGADLITTSNMTSVIAGVYKYNEATSLISLGDAVVVHVAATIDGNACTDRAVITRDVEV